MCRQRNNFQDWIEVDLGDSPKAMRPVEEGWGRNSKSERRQEGLHLKRTASDVRVNVAKQ